MKKMVCDICESKRIKKENAVFVCQDCGTEYTLEEAKNLLKEIPESTITEAVKIENKQPEESFIKEKLYFWAEILKNIDICRFYYSFFENDDARLWGNEELNAQLLLKSKGEYINLFAPLAKYGFSGFSILFDIDNTIERYKSYVMRNPNNREYSEKLNLLEKRIKTYLFIKTICSRTDRIWTIFTKSIWIYFAHLKLMVAPNRTN